MLLAEVPGDEGQDARDEDATTENDIQESAASLGVGRAANMRAKLLRLQDDVLDYQEKVVEERVHNEVLDKQLKELRRAIEQQIVEMGGEMQPARTRALCNRLIENQETKLLKLSNDVSATVEDNRQLKDAVENMRLDRAQFQAHCARREKDIRDRTKRIMDMLKYNSKLYEERNHLKEQTAKLQAAWQEEAMRLNHEREQLDLEIAQLSTDEDLALDRRISSLAVSVKEKFAGKHKEAGQSDTAAQALRRLGLLEEGLQRILTATSCASAEELVQRFQERDHDIFSMFRHLDLQSQEIQELEDTIGELRAEIQALEGTPPASASGDEGRPLVSAGARSAQAKEIARLEALAEAYERRFKGGITVLDGVKAVVERLIDSLGIKEAEGQNGEEEPLPIGGVLEGNVAQWLALIEAKALTMLVQSGHLKPRPVVPPPELHIPDSMFHPTSLADLNTKMSVEDAIRHDAMFRQPPRTARAGGATTRRRGPKLYESPSMPMLSARGASSSPTAAQQAAADAAAGSRGLGFKISPPNIEGDADNLKAFAESQDAVRASDAGSKGKAEAAAEVKEVTELKALEARERSLAAMGGPHRRPRKARGPGSQSMEAPAGEAAPEAARRTLSQSASEPAFLRGAPSGASSPSQSLRARAAAGAAGDTASVRSSRASQRERKPGTGDSSHQAAAAVVLGVQNSPVSASKLPPSLQFGPEFFEAGVRMLAPPAPHGEEERAKMAGLKGLPNLASIKSHGGGAKSARGKRKDHGPGKTHSHAPSEGAAGGADGTLAAPHAKWTSTTSSHQSSVDEPADVAEAAAALATEEAVRGVANSLAAESGDPPPYEEPSPSPPPAAEEGGASPAEADAEIARVLAEVGLDLGPGPEGRGEAAREEEAAAARAGEEGAGRGSPPPAGKAAAKKKKPRAAAGSGRVAAHSVQEARGGGGPMQDALDGPGAAPFDSVILPETRMLWDMLVSTHPKTRRAAEKVSDRATYPAGLQDAVALQQIRRSASERGVGYEQPPRPPGLGHSASASAVGYGGGMYAPSPAPYWQPSPQPGPYGAWEGGGGPNEMEVLDYAAVAEQVEVLQQQQWALAQQQAALLAQLPPSLAPPYDPYAPDGAAYGGYPPAGMGPGGPRKMRSPYAALMDVGSGPIGPSPQARQAIAAKRRKPRKGGPGHSSAPNLMQPLDDGGPYMPPGGFPPPQYGQHGGYYQQAAYPQAGGYGGGFLPPVAGLSR